MEIAGDVIYLAGVLFGDYAKSLFAVILVLAVVDGAMAIYHRKGESVIEWIKLNAGFIPQPAGSDTQAEYIVFPSGGNNSD